GEGRARSETQMKARRGEVGSVRPGAAGEGGMIRRNAPIRRGTDDARAENTEPDRGFAATVGVKRAATTIRRRANHAARASEARRPSGPVGSLGSFFEFRTEDSAGSPLPSRGAGSSLGSFFEFRLCDGASSSAGGGTAMEGPFQKDAGRTSVQGG